MEELQELINEILNKGYLMSLGITDEAGVWVSDVIYVHDEARNLYWLSDLNVRHSQAITKNPQVAVAITISNRPGEENIGLQISGSAEKLNGENYELAVKHRLKRKKSAPTADEKFLEEGEAWYRLKPTKIDLIYEPKYGFNKKHIEL